MQVDPSRLDAIETCFPKLRHLHEVAYRVTSMWSKKYNCIAWAINENQRRLWPSNPFYQWDSDLPQENTIDTFIAFARKHGYEPCDGEELEPGFEKIALYAIGDDPQHMARQLPTGSWTSKLGELEDVRHNSLRSIEGTDYGKVVKVFRRPRVAE